MKILTIGDVVSEQGCDYLRMQLPRLKKELGAELVIVNGENSAVGNGVLPVSAEHILDSGADVITGGNHSLRRREMWDYMEEHDCVLRPANFHASAPGKGYIVIDKGSVQVGVINVMGTVYLENLENPFDCLERTIALLKDQGCGIILVDVHAEATGEKRALGFFLDGRVSAMFGTHTHVQTADAQVLPRGTGYITDLGMCGPVQSVLGVDVQVMIKRMRTNLPARFITAEGACSMEGCLFDIDKNTGRCISAQVIRR